MHYNDVCHSPGYVGFDLIFDICDHNQVLCGDAFHQLYLNTMQSTTVRYEKRNQHFIHFWEFYSSL